MTRRDVLAFFVFFAWGSGFLALGLAGLRDRDTLLSRETIFEIVSVTVGIAGLYVAFGIVAAGVVLSSREKRRQNGRLNGR